IAILRTLGATPAQIMGTFMVQGSLIGVVGTLIGGVLGMALKARQRALVSGDAGLVGSLVPVTQVMAGNPLRGVVLAQGEQWQVQCAAPLQAGQNVRVTARHGVMLDVSPAAPAVQGE
ncbi:FtsX-like permease family protein, partial [Arthrobacter frigidicola]